MAQSRSTAVILSDSMEGQRSLQAFIKLSLHDAEERSKEYTVNGLTRLSQQPVARPQTLRL